MILKDTPLLPGPQILQLKLPNPVKLIASVQVGQTDLELVPNPHAPGAQGGVREVDIALDPSFLVYTAEHHDNGDGLLPDHPPEIAEG